MQEDLDVVSRNDSAAAGSERIQESIPLIITYKSAVLYCNKNQMKVHLQQLTDSANEGVQKSCEDLLLYLSVVPMVPETGERQIETNTYLAYRKHFVMLRYFCALIGDYDLMLVLLETPPAKFCPSMKPETIALFMKWKRQPSIVSETNQINTIQVPNYLRNSGGVVHDISG